MKIEISLDEIKAFTGIGKSADCKELQATETHTGDFIEIGDFNVSGAEIDGVKFDTLYVTGARLVIVDQDENRKIAMFDHVLFDSVISANTDDAESAETFADTALGKYLNGPFRKAILEQTKIKPQEASLITEYEMLGTGNEESNFDENPKRFDFFKQDINRMRFDKNEEYGRWYWLGSKENNTDFCFCSSGGNAYYGNATYTYAVSPALKIC